MHHRVHSRQRHIPAEIVYLNMQIQLFAPPKELQNFFLHSAFIELSCLEASLPAGPCPSIMLMVKGEAREILDDGQSVLAPRFIFRGPYTRPVRIAYTPDVRCISVCFKPGTLADCSELKVANYLNAYAPMEEIADPVSVKTLLDFVSEQHRIDETMHAFHQFLLQNFSDRKKRLSGQNFLAAHQKLFSPLIDIALYFGIGERQLERRVTDAFGLSLRNLRRIARFGFTLLRLKEEQANWGDLTRIAHAAGYYDQAHMHKDFVELGGHAPAALLQKIASQDPAFWMYRIALDDFKKMFYAV